MVGLNVARPFNYRLFGLELASDLELPELPPRHASGVPDAEIVLGPVGEVRSGNGSPETADGAASFSVPDVARYSVADGRKLVVDPASDAELKNVRLYLLGSAMGLLLHQRGIFPLHANALEIDGRAFAFMGPSGAGKSTLAAWFHDRGYRVVADDVCAIHFDDQRQPWVSQGLPRLRLWKSALDATGRCETQFQRSYAGDDEWDKYDVPLRHDAGPDGRLPLAAIYLLGSGNKFSIESLGGVAAVDAIFANTYRGQYLDGADQVRKHWQSSLNLISTIPAFTVSRRWGFDGFGEQAERLVEHARAVAALTPGDGG
jgi:hypothetical protein